jgi:glycosyltransferase involved in cell wall biosynthesis
MPVMSGIPSASKGPLHVAHVVLSLDVGGLERVVLDLISAGIGLGQRTSVACVSSRGSLAGEAEARGATVICAGKSPGLRLGAISRLKAMFEELQPDVVHSHQIGALFYAGPAARRARVPLVVVHSEHGKHYASRLRTRILGRWASRHASRFFCVSNDIADEVRKYRIVDPAKIAVVQNGIDLSRFGAGREMDLRRDLGIPDDVPLVGTIGRLNEIKRQDVLLRAFAALRQSVPTAHLLLVGDGPMRAELEQLAGELAIESVTHFVGYQPQPERYLPLMDIFALTSRSEGMPLVVLEAWAAGVPVITSAVGGLPEMLDAGKAGLLFPPRDHAALGRLLGDVLSDERTSSGLVAEGQSRVRARFSREHMAGEYQRHYLELLAQRAVDED